MFVRSFVRSVRLGMFRGTFQQYHDTESWYGIQYLDNGREKWNLNIRQLLVGTTLKVGMTLSKNGSLRFLAPTLLSEYQNYDVRISSKLAHPLLRLVKNCVRPNRLSAPHVSSLFTF